MRIPLLRGRTFDASDQANSPNAAVVSQSLVRKYWPNEDLIGQTIQFGNMDGDLRLLHVVGVVGDVHDYGVDVAVFPTIYSHPLPPFPCPSLAVGVRAQGGASAVIPAMRETIRLPDPPLPPHLRPPLH